MLFENDQSRKRIIEKRILVELETYHHKFGEGMPMSTLSAKYARALNEVGGFPEVIKELETLGDIKIEYAKSGARTVFPRQREDKAQNLAARWF